MSEEYTIDDLIKKGIINKTTSVDEAQKMLGFANGPDTYFAYDETISILKKEAAAFVGFVLYSDDGQPEHIPDDVWEAMQRIAVQLKLKCDYPMKPLFGTWGPW